MIDGYTNNDGLDYPAKRMVQIQGADQGPTEAYCKVRRKKWPRLATLKMHH